MTLPRRKIQFLLMAVVLGVFFVTSRPACADAYNFAHFNYPGSFLTLALGINNNGDIWGQLGEPYETQFLYQNGNYSLFPGIVYVSNNGMILFNSPSGPAILFNEQVTLLNVPGPVTAINNNGTVLVPGGFVKNAVFTSVKYPGAVGTTVSGINDLDEVVGTYVGSDNRLHGFIYKDGVYTSFDFPVAWTSVHVLGINNNGEIVGNYLGSPVAIIHGFTYENGSYQSFDAFPPVGGGDATIPAGINDFGEIAGTKSPEVGGPQSFVATPVPVPEPGTLSLIGIGLMVIAGAARRRMC
jgi:hypothetical protein